MPDVPPEAPLSRTDDRRTLLFALGAAGATLAVVLGVIGLPAVNACSSDPRGLVTCLRDMADRRFDLPGSIPGRVAEVPATTVAETESLPASGGPLEAPAVEAVTAPVEAPAATPPAAEPPPDPVVAAAPIEAPPATPRPASTAAVEMAAAPEPAQDPLGIETPAVAPSLSEPGAPEPVDSAMTWNAAPEAPIAPPTAVAPIEAKPPAPATQPSLNGPPAATSRPQPSIEVAAPADAGRPAATNPLAPDVPAPEPTSSSAAKPPPPLVVANAEPATAQPPAPTIAAPVILAPTIDAIELDGGQSFVSGSGPAGALMRLYADGQLIGESPVEEGRWLVEGSNLLDSPRRELRIEAIEPDTGKLLGVAAITVEIELPDGGAPPDERPEQAPDQGSGVAPLPQPEPASPTIAGRSPAPPELADNEPPMAAATPQAAPVEEPALVIEPAPTTAETPSEPELAAVDPLPPLAATVPQRESDSVQILAPSTLQPTILPPAGDNADDASTLVLPAPDAPALIAAFDIPAPEPARPRGQPVTILRLLPFGDPDEGRYNVGKAIIRRGDTLWSIARRYYGHGIHYRTIFHANRELIRRPSRIFPGQIFDLPLVTDD